MAEPSWNFAHFKPQAPPKPALQVQPASGKLVVAAGKDYRVRCQAPTLPDTVWCLVGGSLPPGWVLLGDGTLGGPVDWVGEWPPFTVVGVSSGSPKRVASATYLVAGVEN